MDYKLNRAWAEINLDNIAHNVKELRRATSSKAEVMGVVKADAYGHGVKEVVRTLVDNGVTRLAVAILDEALQLRNNGVSVPILVLGYTDPVRADEIITHDIIQTVFSQDLAEALSAASIRLGRKVKVHIKIDTGMTRIGFMPGHGALQDVVGISKLPGIIIEGIYTHFASADESDKSYTWMQFERFMSFYCELARNGVQIPLKHVCNSAGLIEFPEMHLDMVRPGIALYGLHPSGKADMAKIALKPAMTLKTNVVRVKEVEKGTCISYGRTFTTKRPGRIVTLPVGYADGYSRLLSGRGKVLIGGEAVPVVGRICMDQCMADVTDLAFDVETGDEAVLFGRQGEREIPVEEVAGWMGTINYELVCIVSKRVPRVYLRGGRIVKVQNYLI